MPPSRARLPATLLLLLLPACAPPAGPGSPSHAAAPGEPRLLAEPLRVQVRERFYPVEGTSATRINVTLAARGPASGGRRWHAVTDFRLRWRYRPRARAERCVAEAVSFDVEMVTTLPRWQDRDRAAAELASDWDRYLARLREHEEGHRRIVLRESRELLGRVEGLDAPDCAALARRARRLVRTARGEVDAAHHAWDRLTGYGTGGG